MGDPVGAQDPELPATPPAARTLFGERIELAERFVARLADSGVSHGLIGPREVPRLWDRHVLNCAVIGEAIAADVDVIDVGSGAGLPGVALAIARPDLRVVLVEPLERRVRWLEGGIAELGLANVVVRRGKAQAFAGELSAPVVTARAVSRLANLAQWCGPLVQRGGVLLAMKGGSAPAELAEDRAALRRAGFDGEEVLELGAGLVDPPTIVVRAVRARSATGPGAHGGGARALRGRSGGSGRRLK